MPRIVIETECGAETCDDCAALRFYRSYSGIVENYACNKYDCDLKMTAWPPPKQAFRRTCDVWGISVYLDAGNSSRACKRFGVEYPEEK